MRLIGKCLHVGVLDGEEYSEPDRGTTQGSVLSPLLRNVYLHYVLDVWFEREVKPRLRSEATLIRYCDDFIIAFERLDDAERVNADLDGTLKRAISRMLPETESTAASLEFGTYPPMEVFRAMRAENWLHHHGSASHSQAEQIKTRFRRVFYPDTDDWKATIWEQAREVVVQALDGLVA